MYRIGIGAMLLMIIMVLGAIWEVSGQNQKEDMLVPMGVIQLTPPEGFEAKRALVDFDHARHFVRGCKECHHTWIGDTKILNCKASECHNQIKSPGKSKKYLKYTKESILYFKYAYHMMCISCHKEIKMNNRALEMSSKVVKDKLPAAGPSGCVQCHPKE